MQIALAILALAAQTFSAPTHVIKEFALPDGTKGLAELNPPDMDLATYGYHNLSVAQAPGTINVRITAGNILLAGYLFGPGGDRIGNAIDTCIANTQGTTDKGSTCAGDIFRAVSPIIGSYLFTFSSERGAVAIVQAPEHFVQWFQGDQGEGPERRDCVESGRTVLPTNDGTFSGNNGVKLTCKNACAYSTTGADSQVGDINGVMYGMGKIIGTGSDAASQFTLVDRGQNNRVVWRCYSNILTDPDNVCPDSVEGTGCNANI